MPILTKFCVYTGTLVFCTVSDLLSDSYSPISPSVTGSCSYISRLVKLITQRLDFYFTSGKKNLSFLGFLYDFYILSFPLLAPVTHSAFLLSFHEA